MTFFSKIKQVLNCPEKLVFRLFPKWLLDVIPDETFVKLQWKSIKGYPLNLKTPQTFNEKLQWLKLYYHKKVFVMMVDKYLVKEYISKKIGKQYVIPLLGVWERPEEIDFDQLPKQFVLKCNHTSGVGLIICKDKNKLNISETIKELNRGLHDDYYKRGREWPYKNVQRRIIAEEYKTDESGVELKDYKLYCFHGEPVFCQVVFGKGNGPSRSDFIRNIYDMNWNLLDVQYSHPNDPNFLINKPQKFEEMKNLARIISNDEPFVRVDFYNIGEQILFSEITFYPIAGLGSFNPAQWDEKLGKLLTLPNKTK